MLPASSIAAEYAFESPIVSLVKSAVAGLAALGAVDSMAGATTYVLNTNHVSPYTVVAGVAIDPAALTVTPIQAAPSAWDISGSMPPGISFGVAPDIVTAPGKVPEAFPVFSGTPTVPGTYAMMVRAYSSDGSLVTQYLAYTIVVTPSPSVAPNITIQPTSQVIAEGSTVVFNVVASGSAVYQWTLNGNPLSNGASGSAVISGATNATLVISKAGSANIGSYACNVSNPSGSVTSTGATLAALSTNDFGRLINLSTRAQVGTGGNILIAGFVVGGAGTAGSETLLARASGPALNAFNVPGTLPDPQLQLYSGSNVLGTDNGWAGNPTIASTASMVGAFAWTNTTSHDSALDTSLPIGGYTAQIAGESGDTGVSLAEIYDATPAGSFSPTTPRLVNLSARVQVGTGGNILIAGFVIGGSTSRTVLIRASGPALTAFGVPGALPDPELQLFSGSTLLGSNNGWNGGPQISAAAALVGAFAWSSPGSHDSAILVSLPPGGYTAQVAGASGDTGVALVEVYEVP